MDLPRWMGGIIESQIQHGPDDDRPPLERVEIGVGAETLGEGLADRGLPKARCRGLGRSLE